MTTGSGFSMANLGKDPGEERQGGHSRVGRVAIACLLFALIAAQLFFALKALPSWYWALAALGVGLPVTVVVLKRPELGLLVTTALIPLESLASRQNDPLSLFKLFGGLTLVAFLVGWAFQGRYRLVRAPEFKVIGAIMAVLLLSAITTRSPELTQTALRRYLSLFIFYFLFVNLITTRRLARITAWLIMIPVALSSGVAVASYLMGQNMFPADTEAHSMMRSVGTSRDANFFAATILVGLPFYIYFWTLEKSKLARAFLAGGLLVTVLAVVYSFSRGGAIAMGLMLAAIVGSQRLRFSPRVIIAGAAGLVLIGVIGLAAIPSEYGDRLASFRNWRNDDSLTRRTLYIVFGADIIAHRPITGVGPGAFQYVMDTDYQRRFPQRLRSEGAGRSRGRAAHNMYLEIACELGILGIAAFGWLFVHTFRELRRLVRRSKERGPPELLALARSVEVAYWGFLTTSLFLSAEYRKYLWLLLAFVAVLRVLEESNTGYGMGRTSRSRDTVAPAAARGVT